MKKITYKLFCILYLVFSYMGTKAQDDIVHSTDFNVVPRTPVASTLYQYQEAPVDYATGVPEISIPLYHVTLDEVDLPIYLTYHATGIKASDLSTEVGLKWSLHAGGFVSRSINGLADDEDTYGWFDVPSAYQPSSSWNSDINCHQTELYHLSNNNYDVMPDNFSYSVNGLSGSFFFDRDRTLHKDKTDETSINRNFDSGGQFDKFIIIDKMGSEYEFGGETGYTEDNTTTTENTLQASTTDQARSGSGTVTWRLKKITTRSGNEITFTYENYPLDYYILTSDVYRYGSTNPPPSFSRWSEYETRYQVDNKLLLKIETSDVKVDFIYTIDSNASIWQKKLSEIKVTDKIKNKYKSFILEYDRYSTANKLRLKKVKEKGTSGNTSDKVFEFVYNSSTIPSYNSKSIDYFGYYNGKSNVRFTPVTRSNIIDTTANRDVDGNYITNGILSEVIYPTGGKIKYYFEPNQDVNLAGKTIYAPGVRVKKIEELEGSTVINSRRFTYSGLVGNYHVKKEYYFYLREFLDSKYHEYISYSSPVNNFFPVYGYMYKNVDVLATTGPSTWSHRTNYRFADYYKNNIVVSKLIKKTESTASLRDPEIKLRTEEYTYSGNSVISSVPGWIIAPGYEPATSVYCNGQQVTLTNQMYFEAIHDRSFKKYSNIYLTQKTTKDFFDSDSISVEELFTYNNYHQITSSITRLNSSEEYKNTYTYPNDYAYSPYTILTQNNAIALPVSITKSKILPGSLTVTDKTKYSYNTSGNIIEEYTFDDDQTNDVILNREFLYISGTNKIEQVKLRGDRYTTYLWSYNKSLPVGKVEGATKSTVNSIINISTLQGYTSDTSIKSMLTTLRNGLGDNQFVTSFLYDPIYGVTEILNYNNYAQNYIYDEFGRLHLIKNADGYIQNRFIYNYGDN